MKKEVKVKTFTRKTKSGKLVVVRAHTSKRDSGTGVVESAIKTTKKKGAGDELEALLQQARRLSPGRQEEMFESISSIIKEHLAVKDYDGLSLAQAKIMTKNPHIQKALNKGWQLLKPLKGDKKVVLAAPRGYKVRTYGDESRPGDYVWGAVGEDGSYTPPTNPIDRYEARALYEKQAKELNRGTKKKK